MKLDQRPVLTGILPKENVSASRQHKRLNFPFSYAIVCLSTEIREAPLWYMNVF